MPKKINTEIFINRSIEKHGDTYDYDKTIFTHSKNKVIITCKIHGDFEQEPHKHLIGRGCRECGFKKSSNWVNRSNTRKSKVSIESWIDRCDKIHDSKYEYSKVNFNYLTDEVIIICDKHGEFKKRANLHLKSGCARCSKQKLHKDDVMELLNKNTYFDISPFDNYINNRQKIEVSCKKENHITLKSINDLLSNKGKCSFCSKKHRHSKDEWVEMCDKIHNNKYDYSFSIYENVKSKVNIICPLHGEFTQIANSHRYGSGCKKCNKSIGENIITEILSLNKLNYIEQKNFEGLKYKSNLYFDFYLPEYNLCIEFDGLQHTKAYSFFGGEEALKERKLRDVIKNNYCKENNINLLRISHQINYKIRDRVYNIIEEKINNVLNEI